MCDVFSSTNEPAAIANAWRVFGEKTSKAIDSAARGEKFAARSAWTEAALAEPSGGGEDGRWGDEGGDMEGLLPCCMGVAWLRSMRVVAVTLSSARSSSCATRPGCVFAPTSPLACPTTIPALPCAYSSADPRAGAWPRARPGPGGMEGVREAFKPAAPADSEDNEDDDKGEEEEEEDEEDEEMPRECRR